MIPKNRIPTHSGEILLEEFLIPMGLSQVKLAAHISVPVQRINFGANFGARSDDSCDSL